MEKKILCIKGVIYTIKKMFKQFSESEITDLYNKYVKNKPSVYYQSHYNLYNQVMNLNLKDFNPETSDYPRLASIVDFKKWKSTLMPFYEEVIKEINQPDMSLNIYSRWVGDFIKDCNTYTSYDNLIKSGFNGQAIKTDKDLKNQLVKWIKYHI